MKSTICAIVLPHASQEDRFKMNLQHVVYWHTTENCHECGVRQAPPNASLSREWAGSKIHLEAVFLTFMREDNRTYRRLHDLTGDKVCEQEGNYQTNERCQVDLRIVCEDVT